MKVRDLAKRNLAKLVKLLPALKGLFDVNIQENTSYELLKSIVYPSTKWLKSSESQQRCYRSGFEMQIQFSINELVNAEKVDWFLIEARKLLNSTI